MISDEIARRRRRVNDFEYQFRLYKLITYIDIHKNTNNDPRPNRFPYMFARPWESELTKRLRSEYYEFLGKYPVLVDPELLVFPPRLDPFRPPIFNPNVVYYISPDGALELTLGSLESMGQVLFEDEWIEATCFAPSPLDDAYHQGWGKRQDESIDSFIKWLNSTIKTYEPDYAAACFDMYFAGFALAQAAAQRQGSDHHDQGPYGTATSRGIKDATLVAGTAKFMQPDIKEYKVSLGERRPTILVVHDTGGQLTKAGFEAMKSHHEAFGHLYIDRNGDVWENKPLSQNAPATRAEWRTTPSEKRVNSSQLVHVELNSPISTPMITDQQYESLSKVAVGILEQSAGKLTIIPHKEIDRGIAGAHGDPQNFNHEKFENILKSTCQDAGIDYSRIDLAKKKVWMRSNQRGAKRDIPPEIIK